MTEVGSAEFRAKAQFRSIIRQAAAVARSLRDVRDAREEASGDVTIRLDRQSAKRLTKAVESAVEDADPDPIEVEPDVSGFRRGLKRGVDAATRGVTADVRAEADTKDLSRDLRRGVDEASANLDPIDVDSNTEPFAEGVAKGIQKANRSKAEIPVEPDTDRFGEDVEREIRSETRGVSADIPVDPDADGFGAETEREVDRQTRGTKAEIPVEPDTDGFGDKTRRQTERESKKVPPVGVGVEPDTDGFARALQRAIVEAERRAKRIKINTEVDQTGVEEGMRRIQVITASGKYTVTVPAKLSGDGLIAELNRLVREAQARARAESIKVPVEPEDTGVRRKVSLIARLAGAGQKIKIAVEADDSPLKSLRASIGGVINPAQALSGVIGLLKWPALITGAQLAAGALSALAAAGIGAISALGPLGGLLGSLPAIGAAVGGAFGAVKLAFTGVGAALKGYTQSQAQASKAASSGADTEKAAAKARVSALRGLAKAQQGVGDAQKRAADLQVQAVKRVASAERSLSSALKSSQKAQEQLTRARKDAAQQLEDLRRQVRRNALDEEQAILSIDEARQRLAEVNADPESTDLDRRAAILDLAQAEQDLADIQVQRTRDQASLNDAEQKGIEGSDQVVAAKEGIADAEQQVLDAQLELADAQAGITTAQIEGARLVADAQQNLVDALQAVADAAQSAGAAGAAALDPFEEALSKLPRSAQDFVRFLVSLDPLLTRLKTIAADNLFPGLTVGLKNAVTLMPLAEKFTGLFARAVGDAAVQVSQLAFDNQFVSDLDSIGNQGVGLIRTLTSAVNPLAKALAGVGAEAAPLTKFLGDYVAELSNSISAQLESGRASGAMARFFEETRFVFKAVLDTIRNLVGGLIEIGKIAYQVIGKELVGRLDQAGQKFRDFTSSVDGQNKIRKFFEDTKPAIDETIALVKDLAGIFFRLGANPNLAPLIKQIREEFLPVLEKILSGDNSKFASTLIDLGTQVAKVFTALGGPGGPLIIFVETLARIAEAIAFLSDNVPGFSQFVGAVALLIGISKGVSFLGFVTGGSQIVKFFSAKNAEGVSRFATVLGKLSPAFSKLGDVAVLAINSIGKAFLANPWLLVILAVIAAIVLLILNWETVKEKVVAAWQWMYDKAWEIFPGIASAVFQAVDLIKEKWDGIVEWFGGLVDGIAGVWQTVTQPIVDAWDTAWDTVTDNPIVDKVGKVVGDVVEIIKRLWGLTPLGFLVNNWQQIWEDVVAVTSTVWGWITSAVETGVGYVVGVVQDALGVLLPVWEGIWNTVLTVVTTIWDAITENLTALADGMLTIWVGLLDTILLLWDNGWNLVKTVASTVWSWIQTSLSAAASLLTAIWTTLTNTLSTIWTNAWNIIASILSAAWSRIQAIVGALVGWLQGAWGALTGFLSGVWNAAWSGISSVLGGFLGSIRNAIGGALDWIQNRWSSVWNGLASVLGGAWNLIKTVAANGVNGVIGILNTLIKGANAILSKLPGGFSIGEITYRARFADGGAVDGTVPGVGSTDKVKALLTPGEFVIRKASAKAVGVEDLTYINETGKLPRRRYNTGGAVEPRSRPAARHNAARRARYSNGGSVTPISAAPSYQRYAKGGSVDVLPFVFGQINAEGARRALDPLVRVAQTSMARVPGAESTVGKIIVGIGGATARGVQAAAQSAIGRASAQAAQKAVNVKNALSIAKGLGLSIFHSGGGVGTTPSRDMLALLQRGEGVMSTKAVSNVQTALGTAAPPSGTVINNNETKVEITVNNPKKETAEDSIHRSMQKISETGLLPKYTQSEVA